MAARDLETEESKARDKQFVELIRTLLPMVDGSTSGQESVMLSNEDVSASKRSAVACSYWDDPFISFFVEDFAPAAPECHRGLYLRVTTVQRLTEAFLALCGPESQVLSLGAGFDTLYWRLKSRQVRFSNYVELDFDQVTASKVMKIQKAKHLLSVLQNDDGEVRMTGSSLHATDYHLAPADISDLTAVQRVLSECQLRADRPTLVLAECVLMYLKPAASRQLLSYLSSTLPTVLFVNLDMTCMEDRFGELYTKFFHDRGLTISGMESCVSDDKHIQRFLETGWTGAHAWPFDGILHQLPPSEVARMERLEQLQLPDVLPQMLKHYAVAVAWCDASGLGIDSITIAS